jgi:hypothetical protein
MTNSINVIPETRRQEIGAVSVMLVVGLLVLVSIIGASVLRMFSVEAKQTTSEAIGFRLEQLARAGLESNFSLLRSMGATTTFLVAQQGLQNSDATTNRTAVNCNYFPRTDDAKLTTPINGSFQDGRLFSVGAADCLTVRPEHSALVPIQLNRHLGFSNGDIFDTEGQLDAVSASGDRAFRSVFPWTRYPVSNSENELNNRFGSDENIPSHLNQCGLKSQFKSTSQQSGAPLQRYRFQQDFDGLGETWVNMGDSTMNIAQDGLTLESWVWVGNVENSRRIGRAFLTSAVTRKMAMWYLRLKVILANFNSISKAGVAARTQ